MRTSDTHLITPHSDFPFSLPRHDVSSLAFHTGHSILVQNCSHEETIPSCTQQNSCSKGNKTFLEPSRRDRHLCNVGVFTNCFLPTAIPPSCSWTGGLQVLAGFPLERVT
jgi:hypothetical protein